MLSTLPLGLNAVAVWRTLDTSSLAAVPLLAAGPGHQERHPLRHRPAGLRPHRLRPLRRHPPERQHRRPGPFRQRQVLCHQAGRAAGPVPGRAGLHHRPRGRVHRHGPRRRRQVLSPGVPGQGMNPFVIDRGDSEELLQRIGSLRRLIEVMVGERLSAERRSSLDHALAGYYSESAGAHRLPRLLRLPARGDAGDRPPAAALRHRQPAGPALRRGRRPAGPRSPGHRVRPAPAGAGTQTGGGDGLHRDGVGRRRPGPPAPAAGGGRGVEHHAAPRGRGLHGQHGEARPQAPARLAVHHPGRAGPPLRGLLPSHHRTQRQGAAPERRLQAAACSRTPPPSAPWAKPSTCPRSCNAGCLSCPRGDGLLLARGNRFPVRIEATPEETEVIEWRPGPRH